MMRSVVIAIFLMVLGAVVSILNDSGILPSGYQIDGSSVVNFSNTGVTNLSNSMVESEGVLNGLSLFAGIKAVFSALVSALCIAPMLISWGVPAFVAIPLQVPIYFIYIHDFLNWKGNRQLN